MFSFTELFVCFFYPGVSGSSGRMRVDFQLLDIMRVTEHRYVSLICQSKETIENTKDESSISNSVKHEILNFVSTRPYEKETYT